MLKQTNAIYLIGGSIVVILIFIALSMHEKPDEQSGFDSADLVKDTEDPRIADPKHGNATRAQLSMEKRLYRDIRTASTYALPATMTSDAYDVIATEAEPTQCMLSRASKAKEMPLPEGQYTPWEEIESGFIARPKKQYHSLLN